MLWATNKIHLQRHHPIAPIQRSTYHKSSLEELFFYEGQHNDVEAGMISNILVIAYKSPVCHRKKMVPKLPMIDGILQCDFPSP